MKNSKKRQSSKVVAVESGVCEKIQSIEGLKIFIRILPKTKLLTFSIKAFCEI